METKCNCLHWTIHIESVPLLALAISKHDFVLSLSYGLWADELAHPLLLCLCPSTGVWRRQLLVALLPIGTQAFPSPAKGQRGPFGAAFQSG